MMQGTPPRFTVRRGFVARNDERATPATDQERSAARNFMRSAFGALFRVALLRADDRKPIAMLDAVNGLSRHKRPPPRLSLTQSPATKRKAPAARE
jgi:hypothetical protein